MQTGIMNKFLSSSATQGYSCYTLFIQPYYEGARNLKKTFEKEYKFQHLHKLMHKFRYPFPMDLRFLKDRIQFLTAGILLCIPLINTVNLLVLRIFNRYEEIPPIEIKDEIPLIEIKNEDLTVIKTFSPSALNSTEQNDILSPDEEKLLENPDLFPDDQAINSPDYINSNEKEIPKSSSNPPNLVLKIIEEIEEAYADDPRSSFEKIIDNILDNLNLNIIQYENRPDRDAFEDAKNDLRMQIIQLLINPFRILKNIKTKELSDSETVMSLVLEKIQGFKLPESERKIHNRFIFKHYINYKVNTISFFPSCLESKFTKPIMDNLNKEIDFFTQSKAKRKEWRYKIQKIYLKNFLSNYMFTYPLQLSNYNEIEQLNIERMPLMETLKNQIHFFDQDPDMYEISYQMLELYLKKIVEYISIMSDQFTALIRKQITEILLKLDFPDFFDQNPLDSFRFDALLSRLKSRMDKIYLDITWIKQSSLNENSFQKINSLQNKNKLNKLEIKLGKTFELLERLKLIRDLKEEEEEEEEEEVEVTVEYI